MKPLQAFTIMDQNRDGFIDKNDLRDTFAALGLKKSSKDLLNQLKSSWLQSIVFNPACCLQDV